MSNRDFNLLWGSQCLSDLGSAVSTIAIPLLVLAVTHSPVQAGLVGTLAALTRLVVRLPSGVLADRVNRRRAMLTCDAVRLLGYAGLGVTLLAGRVSLTAIIAVAVLDAACGTLFSTSEHAALRNIVPADQLTTAVARNEARSYGVSLAGPPLGGLLFSAAQSLPFLGNAVSYLASMLGVALIRTPLQEPRTEPPAGHATAMAEGLRFVAGNAFLRAVLVIAAPLNFAITGILFTVIVTLQRHGTAPAVIGVAETILGAGGLLGALAAPALQRALSTAALIRLICWAAAALLATSALLTTSLAAAIPLGVAVFLGPACNAALFGYQAAITPDRLQGRVVSVILLAAMSAAAAAPILSGVLVSWWGSAPAILFFALTVAGSAIAATFSGGLRDLPAPAAATAL
ncbi:MFS transporter [Winogradskya consettensis]|uniref:MFS transporter n=1 Tax=Winogradskya consettensis TaxID=113560 RepID=UPI001BB39D69|nr:MFS transporter [Actinoplanes consettensis]